MIALQGNNYLKDLRQLRNQVANENRVSLLEKIYFYFIQRRVTKKAKRINKMLRELVLKFENEEVRLDKETHVCVKDILKETKELGQVNFANKSERLKCLEKDNIDLAYKLEKSVRLNVYSNRKDADTPKTSEFAAAVSSLSKAASSTGI